MRHGSWLMALGATLGALPVLAEDARALFLMELGDTPVGTVELRLEDAGTKYRYTSTHLFTRESAKHRRVRTVALPAPSPDPAPHPGPHSRPHPGGEGGLPESWVLWRGPHDPGCVRVRSELEKREGALCVEARRGNAFAGTLHGKRFDALLGADGALFSFRLGRMKLSRVDGRVSVRPPPDLFAEGFAISGGGEGALTLQPPAAAPVTRRLRPWTSEAAARALAREVHASFPQKEPSPADFEPDEAAQSASCLGHARRFIARAKAQGLDAALVQGLHAQPGEARAFPHAWVRVRLPDRRLLELDPTLQVPVTQTTHLALPPSVWPDLLSEERGVTRGHER